MNKILKPLFYLFGKDYKLLKVIFTVITLLLIFDQFYIYFVSKPTLRFQTKRNLNSEDFPEILFCPNPSVNLDALNSRGYDGKSEYYWGVSSFYNKIESNNEIGWSGNKSETPKQVLEDISILKSDEDCPLNKLSFVWNKLVEKEIKFKLTRVSYPHHICCKIIIVNNTNLDVFHAMQIDLSYLNKFITSFKVLMTDQITASYFNQHGKKMIGDDIELNPNGVNIYQISLTEEENIENDPKFPCIDYKIKFQYGKCIENEILKQSLKLLNCSPPWMTENEGLWCNGLIGYQSESHFYEYYNFIEDVTNSQADTGNCLAPCTVKKYHVKLLGIEEGINQHGIELYFDRNVDVTKTEFKFGFITIISDIGGFMGTSKELMWIIIMITSTFGIFLSKLKYNMKTDRSRYNNDISGSQSFYITIDCKET